MEQEDPESKHNDAINAVIMDTGVYYLLFLHVLCAWYHTDPPFSSLPFDS